MNEIAGMKDKDMTDLVNQWVGDKLISDYGNSRKGGFVDYSQRSGVIQKFKAELVQESVLALLFFVLSEVYRKAESLRLRFIKVYSGL